MTRSASNTVGWLVPLPNPYDHLPAQLPLVSGSQTLGSDPSCEIFLDLPAVRPQHARIEYTPDPTGGVLTLHLLQGTLQSVLINNRPMRRLETILLHDDTFELGCVVFRVRSLFPGG